MKLSKIALTTATAAALTLGSVAAPAASAYEERLPETSSMQIYNSITQGWLNFLIGDRNPSEVWVPTVLSSLPVYLLLTPLALFAHVEAQLLPPR